MKSVSRTRFDWPISTSILTSATCYAIRRRETHLEILSTGVIESSSLLLFLPLTGDIVVCDIDGISSLSLVVDRSSSLVLLRTDVPCCNS
jgi:hypothetical protein